MRTWVTISLLSITACAASTASLPATDEATVAGELTQLKNAVVQAYIHLDAEALDRLYTDDFTVTDAAGETRTKADELEYVRSSTTSSLLEGRYSLIKVRVYGDLAVASGRAQMKAKGKEGPEEFTYDSFNVFRRENGVWRYAAAFTP